jgi:hypothetical protein
MVGRIGLHANIRQQQEILLKTGAAQLPRVAPRRSIPEAVSQRLTRSGHAGQHSHRRQSQIRQAWPCLSTKDKLPGLAQQLFDHERWTFHTQAGQHLRRRVCAPRDEPVASHNPPPQPRYSEIGSNRRGSNDIDQPFQKTIC